MIENMIDNYYEPHDDPDCPFCGDFVEIDGGMSRCCNPDCDWMYDGEAAADLDVDLYREREIEKEIERGKGRE